MIKRPKIGDLVEVDTKHYGTKIGTVIENAGAIDTRGETWIVHIPNHPTVTTIAMECNMRVL